MLHRNMYIFICFIYVECMCSIVQRIDLDFMSMRHIKNRYYYYYYYYYHLISALGKTCVKDPAIGVNVSPDSISLFPKIENS